MKIELASQAGLSPYRPFRCMRMRLLDVDAHASYLFQQLSLQDLGLAIPDAVPVIMALAATTFLAALGTVVENTVSVEEVVSCSGCNTPLPKIPRTLPLPSSTFGSSMSRRHLNLAAY